MTIYYPDISSFQSGVSLAGLSVVMVKATEGTGYVNPDYLPAKARAAKAKAYFCAYHYLHAGSIANQAGLAFHHVGKIPLMVDFEPTTGSNPGIADAVAFINQYRAQGGITYLLYLPRWYWAQLGQPSLYKLSELGMLLVSSEYGIGYSDKGHGWAAYGGMTPAVWQYTDNATLNGVHPVDYNAFKGSADDLASLATTGALPGPEPVLTTGDSGPAVVTLQTRLNVWGAKLPVDGQFGPATFTAVRSFQTVHKLTSDGVVGPQTWAALDASPPSPRPAPYPAPGGLAAGKVSLAVSWKPVLVSKEPVASYTIQAVGKNGQVYVSETSATNSAVLAGLTHGWTYTVNVWANGGPSAPPHASIIVTV
jgi:Glycosyl hydrolases family 25/Putative peptidoglycan binding domain